MINYFINNTLLSTPPTTPFSVVVNGAGFYTGSSDWEDNHLPPYVSTPVDGNVLLLLGSFRSGNNGTYPPATVPGFTNDLDVYHTASVHYFVFSKLAGGSEVNPLEMVHTDRPSYAGIDSVFLEISGAASAWYDVVPTVSTTWYWESNQTQIVSPIPNFSTTSVKFLMVTGRPWNDDTDYEPYSDDPDWTLLHSSDTTNQGQYSAIFVSYAESPSAPQVYIPGQIVAGSVYFSIERG